mmetsp:Transcript_706/g.2349  ORF Transcript_706/g.2349 Transcript_706/m.2349 type:complete len:109 (+) Transcript_706:341-667(+)
MRPPRRLGIPFMLFAVVVLATAAAPTESSSSGTCSAGESQAPASKHVVILKADSNPSKVIADCAITLDDELRNFHGFIARMDSRQLDCVRPHADLIERDAGFRIPDAL